MDIKSFLNIYGTDTTTNFQLMKWAKDLGISNFHYAMKDEINNLESKTLSKTQKHKKLPIYIIANYQMSNEGGSHHVVMFKDKNESFYFDSYGIQPLKEAEDFLEDGVYSSFKIQPENTFMCGQLSLFVLYKLKNGYSFYDTILELNDYF